MYDLSPALNPPMGEDWRRMSKEEYELWLAKKTRCSALVKLAYDLSDIFFGHATWSTYNTMLRSYKHYTLNYASSVSKEVSFSGYPGLLSSLDDFYVTDQWLTVMETSIAIINTSMYDGNIRTESVLYWVRVMVTNRMASSAPQWAELFSLFNSGTYNNQWMIVDNKLFRPGNPLSPNTFWVVEQLPGVVASNDETSTLQYGYWPSYNLPSNKTLYKAAGYEEAAALKGWEMNDYQRCVRAQIFRRDQSSVVDLRSFQFMMQYNNYQQDSVSQFNPTYAVAARGDIAAPGNFPMCFGAIDAKTTSWKMIHEQHGRVEAYSGPTPQQPPFDFNSTKATMMCTPHDGEPGLWNFSFVPMTPPNF